MNTRPHPHYQLFSSYLAWTSFSVERREAVQSRIIAKRNAVTTLHEMQHMGRHIRQQNKGLIALSKIRVDASVSSVDL
jgi:hypothetical protein